MVNSLRRSVLRNFGLKLMSLILAIGLWLAVSHDPPAEVEHSVPIEFLHFPDNLEMASESVPQARVRLRGPERLIHGVRPTDIHVEIDLTGTKAGERTFDLTAQQVREPRDLKVVQIVPGQFRMAFDATHAAGRSAPTGDRQFRSRPPHRPRCGRSCGHRDHRATAKG